MEGLSESSVGITCPHCRRAFPLLAAYAEGASDEDIRRADLAAEKVRVKVSDRDYAAAHAAIERAHVDLLTSEADQRKHKLDPQSIPVSEIGLELRVVNYLESAGIITLGQLLETRRETLLAIPSFGATYLVQTIRQVRLTLEQYGLYSPPDETAGQNHAQEVSTPHG